MFKLILVVAATLSVSALAVAWTAGVASDTTARAHSPSDP